MSLPREGSRTVREGIVVAEAMDWCRSPTAIVPYTIDTHHQVEGASIADSVRQTDERSHVRGSLIRQCYGANQAWAGRDVRDAGGGMRAEDMVVERAGGRAPHGTPRRRVVDEPQEHVWSADLRQGYDRFRKPHPKLAVDARNGLTPPIGSITWIFLRNRVET